MDVKERLMTIYSMILFRMGFLWGTATSSYQIEGAWNISGKFDKILPFPRRRNLVETAM